MTDTVLLPRVIDYTQKPPALPSNTQSFVTTINPSNGNTFSAGSVIIFDLLQRGFIDTSSLYLRYKIKVESGTTVPQVIGTPVFTPILRYEEIIGSQVVCSINQYNQVANLLVNCTYDIAQKAGLQNAFGYLDATTSINQNMAKLDGRTLSAATGETYYVSAPLIGGMLSNCEKLYPAFATPNVRIQLTLDSILNMFSVGASTVTAVTLSNVELVYNLVDFGSEVEQMVRSMGDKIYIKSQSFSNASSSLASGSSGSQTLIFNQRYASVKAGFINFSGTDATAINLWGDSLRPSADAQFYLQVGGVSYPQRPLSINDNPAGILQELRRAINCIYDKNNSLSINAIEWNYKSGDTTTTPEPAKFYGGISFEKIQSAYSAVGINAPNLLTGISTQSSPISLVMNIPTATSKALNVNLILNYDILIEIDLSSRQVSVKQ